MTPIDPKESGSFHSIAVKELNDISSDVRDYRAALVKEQEADDKDKAVGDERQSRQQ